MKTKYDVLVVLDSLLADATTAVRVAQSSRNALLGTRHTSPFLVYTDAQSAAYDAVRSAKEHREKICAAIRAVEEIA